MTETEPQQFHDADLTGATFYRTDLTGAQFRWVPLNGAVLHDVELFDVEITGDIRNLTINGVDVTAYVEAELDRRNPGRADMRPTDADGFRRAWDILEPLWAGTVDRARGLPPELLDERVDGEWAFLQTLRHLVFATDSWVSRCLLGERAPWHPLSLPWEDMRGEPGYPIEIDARPDLDTVLALRADRMATVRRVLDDLTDQRLTEQTTPVDGAGWPPPDRYDVREVLLTVLNEEWEHRRFAERDLDLLAARR